MVMIRKRLQRVLHEFEEKINKGVQEYMIQFSEIIRNFDEEAKIEEEEINFSDYKFTISQFFVFEFRRRTRIYEADDLEAFRNVFINDISKVIKEGPRIKLTYRQWTMPFTNLSWSEGNIENGTEYLNQMREFIEKVNGEAKRPAGPMEFLHILRYFHSEYAYNCPNFEELKNSSSCLMKLAMLSQKSLRDEKDLTQENINAFQDKFNLILGGENILHRKNILKSIMKRTAFVLGNYLTIRLTSKKNNSVIRVQLNALACVI